MKPVKGVLHSPDTIYDEINGISEFTVVDVIDVQITNTDSGPDMHVIYVCPNGEIRKVHPSRIKVKIDECEREDNSEGLALSD